MLLEPSSRVDSQLNARGQGRPLGSDCWNWGESSSGLRDVLRPNSRSAAGGRRAAWLGKAAMVQRPQLNARSLNIARERVSKREPKALRRGKRFHRTVQAEWQQDAEGEVAVEKGVRKPAGRRGRIDIFVDAGDRLTAVAEIKASDWDRMTESALRRNVSRQARQILDYIESQLVEGKEVCPGVVFPRRPKSRQRLEVIEALFEEQGIAVVWQDESLEERRARAGLPLSGSDSAV